MLFTMKVEVLSMLFTLKVEVFTAGGRAMRPLRVQMRPRQRMAFTLEVFGSSGDMMALLLSSVMASMVRTEAGTETRDRNWLKEQ